MTDNFHFDRRARLSRGFTNFLRNWRAGGSTPTALLSGVGGLPSSPELFGGVCPERSGRPATLRVPNVEFYGAGGTPAFPLCLSPGFVTRAQRLKHLGNII